VRHVKEGDHVMTTWVDRDNSTTTQPRVAHALNDRAQYTLAWKGKEVMHSAATWAEYALAQERVVLPLPEDVPTDVTAIIGCAVMTGAGAIINTLQVRQGESVAVFGAGGIGLCAIAAAAIVDAYPIIAVDVTEEKLAFSRRFGATHTLNARQTDAVTAIQELTGGGAPITPSMPLACHRLKNRYLGPFAWDTRVSPEAARPCSSASRHRAREQSLIPACLSAAVLLRVLAAAIAGLTEIFRCSSGGIVRVS
jgi:Zn-dependent alcohol dehydrogenase